MFDVILVQKISAMLFGVFGTLCVIHWFSSRTRPKTYLLDSLQIDDNTTLNNLSMDIPMGEQTAYLIVDLVELSANVTYDNTKLAHALATGLVPYVIETTRTENFTFAVFTKIVDRDNPYNIVTKSFAKPISHEKSYVHVLK